VVRLESLTPEDCYVLLHKIREVFDGGEPTTRLLPDEGIVRYLEICQQRMGAAYFQTPRDTVKDFVGLLQVLQQNPTTSWNLLLDTKQSEPFAPTSDPVVSPPEPDDDLSTFRL